MKQHHSWEITDAFWEATRPLFPKKGSETAREYRQKPEGGRPSMDPRKVLEAIFYVLRTGIKWKAIPKHMEGQAPSTGISGSGVNKGSFRPFGLPERKTMLKRRVSTGSG